MTNISINPTSRQSDHELSQLFVQKNVPERQGDYTAMTKDESNRINSFFSTLKWQEAYTLDRNGLIISSNLEIVNVTGYEEWEVMGKHISIFYIEEDIASNKPFQDLHQAAVHGRFVTDGIKNKKKKIPFLSRFRITATYDGSHQLAGYKLILSDLTQKAIFGQRFKRLKQEYQHLFENSCVGIIKFNGETGKIILINQYAEDTLSLKAGAYLHEAFSAETEYLDLTRRIKKGNVDGFEFQVNTPFEKNKKWISLECKDLGFDGLVEGILFDISRIKSNEAESLRLRNELDSFIYSASHDLRSPLTTVQGLLNLIDMAKSVDEIPNYTTMVKDKINELDYLLKYLSTIASNNTSDLIIERISLEDECRLIFGEIAYKNGSVKTVLEINETKPFHSDLLRVRTILKNLISNAMRFTQPEGESSVKITASVDDDQCVIIIEDNGSGIEDAQLMKIYNLFYKRNTKNGAGLGLYVTKSMIDKLKGRIYVKSQVAKGTTFTITLPNSKSDSLDQRYH
jgi:signal transduction histidine kinase